MRADPENAGDEGEEVVPGLAEEVSSYAVLLRLLHPDGLACPRCRSSDGLRVHRRARDPVVDYFCAGCLRVFNAWTGTVLQGTHRPPSQVFAILRGIVANTPTARLARELGCQRAGLVATRRRLIALARVAAERGLLDGPATRPTAAFD